MTHYKSHHCHLDRDENNKKAVIILTTPVIPLFFAVMTLRSHQVQRALNAFKAILSLFFQGLNNALCTPARAEAVPEQGPRRSMAKIQTMQEIPAPTAAEAHAGSMWNGLSSEQQRGLVISLIEDKQKMIVCI